MLTPDRTRTKQANILILYRPDIDGLRAIAILPVVLFHAGVPGFSGGFVGVDVFFVISGFLITSIIRDEMSVGHFTIAGFYERRVRRILPALFVVLAVTVLLAAWTLYPNQFLAFSRSLVAVPLFASSFLFRSEAGYFDIESEQKPLLHTWSLSVEEIFYILFPFLLLALVKRSQRLQVGILGAIAMLSLALSSVALAQDPKSPSAFFLPYSRAWELLLGALLAYRMLPGVGERWRDALGLAGILMIAVSVVAYSNATIFPGLAALLPCVGAAMVIYAGQQGVSLGGRLLSTPGMVYIGKISYPIYLWHWPLFVFAQAGFGEELPYVAIALVVTASTLAAALSTHFIEQPFRGRGAILSRRQVFVFSGLGLALFVMIGLAGVSSNGWSQRYPPEVGRILFAEQDRDPRKRECLTTKARARGCLYGDRREEPTVALWGDSHAAMYAVMLGELATEREQSVLAFTMPSCPPLDVWALQNQSWRERCLAFQEQAIQSIIETPSIRTVLLSGRFAGYPIEESNSGFEAALRRTIHRLQGAGKQVLVIYPVPEYGEHVPLVMGRALNSGQVLVDLTRPLSNFLRTFEPELEFLDMLVTSEQIGAIRPSKVLCDGANCYFYRDGVVLYHDEHHLSLSGADQLKPIFRHLF